MVMLTISLAAFLLAGFKVPGLDRLRHIAVFFALGAGQIHLAVLALMMLLFAENGYRPPRTVPRNATIALFIIVNLIVLVTLLSPISGRTVSELIQLFVYAVVFMMFTVYLRGPRRIEPMLKAMVVAATLVALLGIAGFQSGLSTAPHIYLGRGGNEGSFFLLVAGLLPALTLFVSDKRPIYILLAVIMLFAMVMATSRSNMAIGMFALGSTGFFLIRSIWLRVLLLGVLIGVLIGAIIFPLSLLQVLFEQQKNFSTLQRIALYEAGWSLWLERPWTGWGWGSTSVLAPQNNLTVDRYPHFHSTYVQFIVELGALGWVYSAVWVAGSLWLIISTALFRTDAAGGFYISLVSVVLLLSGVTEALLFGADRAVQVMLALALIGAFIRRGRRLSMQRRVTRPRQALSGGTPE